jgi:ppGpp synthetase/RelA/SpoT-type nucleotidyltranferase
MTDNYLKVIDAPGLLRDPYSKALVSADSAALQEHRKKRKALVDVINKNKELEEKVEFVLSKLNSIESILLKLAEKQTNG